MANDDNKRDESTHRKKSPGAQNYVALGIALGAGAGTALGVAFENIGVGIGVGIGIGLVIGSVLEARRRTKPRDDDGADNQAPR